MKRFFQFILFTLTISSLSFAQGYQIQLNLKSAPNKEVYLAHYYIGNIFVDDTLQLDASGSGLLKGDSLLPQGLYKIYMDDKNHFDFLLGADQNFSISNQTFAGNTIQITDAIESEEFIKYVVFLNNLKKEGADLNKKLKSAPANEKGKIQSQLNELTPNLHQYWKQVKNDFPNSFLGKFLMSSFVPKLDESTLPDKIQQNDSLLLLARFKYQQKHFWDYFDYTDERFLYTPLLKPKMETWFTKVLYQNYDSVQQPVFEFIENIRPNKRIFQFAASFFLNSSINSNIMGMDALFIDIAKRYYLNGEAFWASEESLKKIRENVLFMESNLIGKIAPNLTLENVDGEYFDLHQIEKKRTCVLIYEPNCSHCKEFVPEFYNTVYQKYKDKGLEVFAIYSMDNKEEWVEFLDKNNLWNWINVWDKDHISRFKILYDARKTPGIYVLDENKKIIAKKMTIEQLDRLMENDLN
jgi:peroxiredoxin